MVKEDMFWAETFLLLSRQFLHKIVEEVEMLHGY